MGGWVDPVLTSITPAAKECGVLGEHLLELLEAGRPPADALHVGDEVAQRQAAHGTVGHEPDLLRLSIPRHPVGAVDKERLPRERFGLIHPLVDTGPDNEEETIPKLINLLHLVDLREVTRPGPLFHGLSEEARKECADLGIGICCVETVCGVCVWWVSVVVAFISIHAPTHPPTHPRTYIFRPTHPPTHPSPIPSQCVPVIHLLERGDVGTLRVEGAELPLFRVPGHLGRAVLPLLPLLEEARDGGGADKGREIVRVKVKLFMDTCHNGVRVMAPLFEQFKDELLPLCVFSWMGGWMTCNIG